MGKRGSEGGLGDGTGSSHREKQLRAQLFKVSSLGAQKLDLGGRGATPPAPVSPVSRPPPLSRFLSLGSHSLWQVKREEARLAGNEALFLPLEPPPTLIPSQLEEKGKVSEIHPPPHSPAWAPSHPSPPHAPGQLPSWKAQEKQWQGCHWLGGSKTQLLGQDQALESPKLLLH